jgi:hypothetical protein
MAIVLKILLRRKIIGVYCLFGCIWLVGTGQPAEHPFGIYFYEMSIITLALAGVLLLLSRN